jgi:hypothetical protein
MLRPPFDYILSYDPLLQLTIYPDPLLPFTLFLIVIPQADDDAAGHELVVIPSVEHSFSF